MFNKNARSICEPIGRYRNRDFYSTERQITHLPFPLTLKAALSQQQNVLNSYTNRNMATDLKDTRH